MKIELIFKDGRKETFEDVASFSVTDELKVGQEQSANKVRLEAKQPSAREVAQTPTEGKLFEIDPFGIDRRLFLKVRVSERQEWKRQIINRAFVEIDKRPQEYAEPFYTLIPEKTWDDYKTVDELKQYAKDLGGKTADWIQQALEWAQRICNGETWEAVDTDTAKWYCMIVWETGFCRLVRGLRGHYDDLPASGLICYDFHSYDVIYDTVPLVAIKKH